MTLVRRAETVMTKSRTNRGDGIVEREAGNLYLFNFCLKSANDVDALYPCVYDNVASGRLGDRGPALSGSRKVRTP
jgi:hypothetical protein